MPLRLALQQKFGSVNPVGTLSLTAKWIDNTLFLKSLSFIYKGVEDLIQQRQSHLLLMACLGSGKSQRRKSMSGWGTNRVTYPNVYMLQKCMDCEKAEMCTSHSWLIGCKHHSLSASFIGIKKWAVFLPGTGAAYILNTFVHLFVCTSICCHRVVCSS